MVHKYSKAFKMAVVKWVKANPEEAQRRVRDELSFIMKRELSVDLIKQAWTRLIPEAAITLEPFEKFQERAKQVGLLRTPANLSNLLAP